MLEAERLRHSAHDWNHPRLWRDRIYREAGGAGVKSEGIELHPGGPERGKSPGRRQTFGAALAGLRS
jgi:hypothetical protein